MKLTELLSSLGNISIQVVFAKMYIPEMEKLLAKQRIKITNYVIESWDGNLYVTGTFSKKLSESKLKDLKHHISQWRLYPSVTCGESGFSVEIK